MDEYQEKMAKLQAKIDHNNKRIGQCILLGAAVLVGGMFMVMILAMLGL